MLLYNNTMRSLGRSLNYSECVVAALLYSGEPGIIYESFIQVPWPPNATRNNTEFESTQIHCAALNRISNIHVQKRTVKLTVANE